MQEWEAFYEIEPWGCAVEDGRWSQLYALEFRANFKGTEPQWLDRDPEGTARRIEDARRSVSLDDRILGALGRRIVEVEAIEFVESEAPNGPE